MIETVRTRSLHQCYVGTCGKLCSHSDVPRKRMATVEETAGFTLALASGDFP
jgi:hypothetical protein